MFEKWTTGHLMGQRNRYTHRYASKRGLVWFCEGRQARIRARWWTAYVSLARTKRLSNHT